MKKFWIDTKHKSTHAEIADIVDIIIKELEEYQPELVMLGDDNAANYIGNYYLDMVVVGSSNLPSPTKFILIIQWLRSRIVRFEFFVSGHVPKLRPKRAQRFLKRKILTSILPSALSISL